MKVNELLEKGKGYNGGYKYGIWGHASEQRLLEKYLGEEVVAYSKNGLGIVFVVKGKQKFFGFVSLRGSLNFHGYDYKLVRVDLKEVIELMGKDLVIVNENNFGLLRKNIILEAIK